MTSTNPTALGGTTGSGKSATRTIIATCGLPGSGKTTFALKEIEKALAAGDEGVCRANRDAIRIAHAGRRLGTGRQEAIVTRAQDEMIRAEFEYGYHTVIVDDTNLHGFSHLRALAAELGAELKVKDFRHVPVSTCIMRDKIRPEGGCVGAEVIQKMHDELVLPHLRQIARRATA